MLPPKGRLVCFVASYLLMLYADWLLMLGSWKQAVITFGDQAPATGLSVGLFFYSSGVVFGISAAVILIYDLLRVITGRADGDDLIAVKETEER
jgi:TRAP-type C4-dicarboxylate transport system permease small subunit